MTSIFIAESKYRSFVQKRIIFIQNGIKMAISFFKKESFPIGVDLGSSYLKMAQLSPTERIPQVHAASCLAIPDGIKTGSPEWQKWAIKAVKQIATQGGFKGKSVITAMPSDDVFIDQVRINRNDNDIENSVMDSIKGRLPFESQNAIIKYIVSDEDASSNSSKADVLVMATDKIKIDRLLAIYENAGLELKNLSVWPLALVNTYIKFFGRRQSDKEQVVMLIDIGSRHTNVVITRYTNILFARSIGTGFKHLDESSKADGLVKELSSCVRYTESASGGTNINKLLFLSGRNTSKAVCEKIAALAKDMHIPAQIGDVLAAVESNVEGILDIDRRNSQLDWATCFGLSLSN